MFDLKPKKNYAGCASEDPVGIVLQKYTDILWYFFFALFLSDVLVKLRKTLSPPFRPEIPKDLEECDKRYIQLMKQCWDNEPAVRPNFTDIKLQLRIMNGRKLVLLMDKCPKHWLSLLVRTKK